MSTEQDKHPDYITVTSGLRGYFAVHMSWCPSRLIDNGYYEPWQTSSSSFKEKEGAIKDGKIWAKSEDIEFK